VGSCAARERSSWGAAAPLLPASAPSASAPWGSPPCASPAPAPSAALASGLGSSRVMADPSLGAEAAAKLLRAGPEDARGLSRWGSGWLCLCGCVCLCLRLSCGSSALRPADSGGPACCACACAAERLSRGAVRRASTEAPLAPGPAAVATLLPAPSMAAFEAENETDASDWPREEAPRSSAPAMLPLPSHYPPPEERESGYQDQFPCGGPCSSTCLQRYWSLPVSCPSASGGMRCSDQACSCLCLLGSSTLGL